MNRCAYCSETLPPDHVASIDAAAAYCDAYCAAADVACIDTYHANPNDLCADVARFQRRAER